MKSLLAFCIGLTLVSACQPRTLTPDELAQSDLIITNIQTAPVEYKLAYLDSGHLPKGTDVNASRIRFLLRSLSEKTGDNTQQIADRTSQATAVLKSNFGRAVTHQQFLEEAYQYLEAGGPKTSFNDMATFLTLTMGK